MQCTMCGKEFLPKRVNQLTCSIDCAIQRNRILNREYHRTHKPKKPPKVCVVCGKEFIPKSNAQSCCSTQCSLKKKIMKMDFRRTSRKLNGKKTVEDWASEAKECGMTYGKYRAAVELLGKTFEELKQC